MHPLIRTVVLGAAVVTLAACGADTVSPTGSTPSAQQPQPSGATADPEAVDADPPMQVTSETPVVRGSVTRPDGSPAPGSTVAVFLMTTETDGGVPAVATAVTDPAGRFTLDLRVSPELVAAAVPNGGVANLSIDALAGGQQGSGTALSSLGVPAEVLTVRAGCPTATITGESDCYRRLESSPPAGSRLALRLPAVVNLTLNAADG